MSIKWSKKNILIKEIINFMAWQQLRTLINRTGLTFNENKTSVLFAEDYNNIKENLDYLKVIVDSLVPLIPVPAVITFPTETDIDNVSALVGATLDCGSSETTYSIEYGVSTSYGSTQAGGVTSENGVKTVSLTGLNQNTLYHWRFKAVNVAGTVYSEDQNFTTYNTELINYIAGLATPLGDTQKLLVNNFVKDIKSGLSIADLDDAFDFIYLLAGETSESSLKNLVKNAHHATAVSSPTFTAGHGFAGNGTSSYLDTNYNPSTEAINYLLDSASIGIYSNTNISTGVMADMGCRTSSSTNRIFLGSRFNDTFLGHLNTNFVSAETANTDSRGSFIITRTNTSVQVDYKNGNVSRAGTDTSTGLPNANMVIGAINTAGTKSLFSTREYAFAFAGRGFTQAEVYIIHGAIAKYLNEFYLASNILYSGSSSTASYAGASAISTLVSTLGSEIDIATPAHTIANQLSAYNALTTLQKQSLNDAFVMIGGNNMEPSTTADSVINQLRDYITAMKTGSPQMRIHLATLHPCKQRWIDLYGATDGLISQQKWADYNEAIRGNGSNPITNADVIFDQHTIDLNDGNGNLAPAYDTGDHIHMTDAGKAFIVNAFLATF